MQADERSRAGLFLAFQYPVAIPGVSVANFLRTALQAHRGKDADMTDFRKLLKTEMKALGVDEVFATRYLNDGFSGGEKKRIEILQMSILRPKMAILDETDSGLDIDALKTVAEGINRFHNDQTGILLVTHYQRLLNYIKPDYVHVMMDGQLVKSGGPELALKLEELGYEWVETEIAQKAGV
jgi:Fe-S cluster assembly ATP-binding protein